MAVYSCKFEHPPKDRVYQGQSQNNQNRFAPLQEGNTGARAATNAFGGVPDMRTPLPYSLDRAIIVNDLRDHPEWVLSAYGPGKDAPAQLFGGIREQSFEEMRLYHYQAAAAGKEQQAIQDFQMLVHQAKQQMRTALNDVDGAIKYIIDSGNQHPNRQDICAQSSSGGIVGQAGGPAAQSVQQNVGAFRPTPPQGGVVPGGFGAPSAPAAGGMAFGAPSILGAERASAFGQPSQMGMAGSAFGQPSQLGQPAAAFGQPSPMGGISIFGNIGPGPSAGAFGSASQSGGGAFGQPSQLAAGAFGQRQQPAPGFSQPSQVQGPGLGPLSQPAAFPSSSGGFGRPSGPTSSSAFGTRLNPEANPFGPPAQPAPSNPFASGSATRNPFASSGQPISGPMDVTAPTQMDTGHATNATSQPTSNHTPSDPRSYSTRDPASNKLLTWKSKPVQYLDDGAPYFRRDDDDRWERIWFPDGPPAYTQFTELPAEMYDAETEAAYRYLGEHGVWKDGEMPELPPKREWCSWDF